MANEVSQRGTIHSQHVKVTQEQEISHYSDLPLGWELFLCLPYPTTAAVLSVAIHYWHVMELMFKSPLSNITALKCWILGYVNEKPNNCSCKWRYENYQFSKRKITDNDNAKICKIKYFGRIFCPDKPMSLNSSPETVTCVGLTSNPPTALQYLALWIDGLQNLSSLQMAENASPGEVLETTALWQVFNLHSVVTTI